MSQFIRAHLWDLTDCLRGQVRSHRSCVGTTAPAAPLKGRSALARDGGGSDEKSIAEKPPSRASLAPTGSAYIRGQARSYGAGVGSEYQEPPCSKVGADSSAKRPVNPTHFWGLTDCLRGQVRSHRSYVSTTTAAPLSGRSALARDGGGPDKKVLADKPPSRASLAPTGSAYLAPTDFIACRLGGSFFGRVIHD
jgi:hypothetical protein